MPDNTTQQIMATDAYRPQGMGGEWLGTQLPGNPATSGLDTGADIEPDDAAHRTTGGMWAIVVLLAAATLTAGAVGFVLGSMVRP